MEVGDTVLLVEVFSRGKWAMGNVLTVYRNKDGKVRSVGLRVSGGTFKRHITKISVIYSGPTIAKTTNYNWLLCCDFFVLIQLTTTKIC